MNLEDIHHYFSIIKKSNFRFFLFSIALSILLTAVIYFRESNLIDEISFVHVLIWQLTIWTPWSVSYTLFLRFKDRPRIQKHSDLLFFTIGIFWIGIHFIWFFLISSNFSPYLGKPATGYGVYPYFFIFWTLIDFMILITIYFISKQAAVTSINSLGPKTYKLELTRGGETILCTPQEIYWLSSDNYYTHLQTSYGKFIMRNTLKYYYEMLQSNNFLQIHRSTVINIDFVIGLSKIDKKLFVLTKDQGKHAVSRNNAAIVKEKFQKLKS